jgi:exodeoxyribonuclease III
MKIVTWNCNMVYRYKHRRLVEAFDPDLMIIQECEEPGRLREMIDKQYEILWGGGNKNRGLAIIAKESLKLKLLSIEPGRVRYVLPVEAKNGLKIVAFWATGDLEDRKQRYIGQVWVGLNKCLEYLDERTIVLGDFGWNETWDRAILGPLYGKFTDVTSLLRKYQLESAYHYLRGQEFGEETEKTFYDSKRIEKDYHTDYMFVPVDILNQVKRFSIGQYKEWIHHSDHMPLMIEF